MASVIMTTAVWESDDFIDLCRDESNLQSNEIQGYKWLAITIEWIIAMAFDQVKYCA